MSQSSLAFRLKGERPQTQMSKLEDSRLESSYTQSVDLDPTRFTFK